MASNVTYHGAEDLPEIIPVFPLAGAVLLPRGNLPLNIFEPRYLELIDDTLADERVFGMIQPDESRPHVRGQPALYQIGCVGRITQFAETGDGRYLLSLTGIARFFVREELSVVTPYRQCRVEYRFPADFQADAGAKAVNREEVLKTLAAFLKANDLKLDWTDIEKASNELLVNALCMLSPFGVAEKQAMLEAPDLKARADVLVAVTRFALARTDDGEPPLQ